MSRPTKALLADLAPARSKRRTTAGLSDAAKRRCVIGVMDISARAGLLFHVLERVNRRQHSFQFVSVDAAIPTNVGVMSERLIELAVGYGGDPTDPEWSQVTQNVYAPEFYPWLEKIRTTVEADRLVGAVGPMLAFLEDDEFHWNYFSLHHEQSVMVSTFGVRDYSRRAKRPFEACVATSLIGQVWQSLYDVSYHEETIGCVFDHCANRDEIVQKFRKVEISPQALAMIPEEAHADVLKSLEAIRTYER